MCASCVCIVCIMCVYVHVCKAVTVAETQLGKTDWLAGGHGPSLADIAAYQEISQCQEKFMNLFDFGSFTTTVW